MKRTDYITRGIERRIDQLVENMYVDNRNREEAQDRITELQQIANWHTQRKTLKLRRETDD